MPLDRQLSLQVAYQISEDLASRPVADLFWAVDRLYADRAQVDVHAQHQRSEAAQRIARELDARGVPVRDPAQQAAAEAAIAAELCAIAALQSVDVQ